MIRVWLVLWLVALSVTCLFPRTAYVLKGETLWEGYEPIWQHSPTLIQQPVKYIFPSINRYFYKPEIQKGASKKIVVTSVVFQSLAISLVILAGFFGTPLVFRAGKNSKSAKPEAME